MLAKDQNICNAALDEWHGHVKLVPCGLSLTAVQYLESPNTLELPLSLSPSER
jgi:hypothetical protein